MKKSKSVTGQFNTITAGTGQPPLTPSLSQSKVRQPKRSKKPVVQSENYNSNNSAQETIVAQTNRLLQENNFVTFHPTMQQATTKAATSRDRVATEKPRPQQ
jgi:hypothetical protein